MSISVVIRYDITIGVIAMKAKHAGKLPSTGFTISYYRKLRGLTQEQLAELVGLAPAFIGHVEALNIKKAISLDTLFDIAEVLEIPAYKFLQFDPNDV